MLHAADIDIFSFTSELGHPGRKSCSSRQTKVEEPPPQFSTDAGRVWLLVWRYPLHPCRWTLCLLLQPSFVTSGVGRDRRIYHVWVLQRRVLCP